MPSAPAQPGNRLAEVARLGRAALDGADPAELSQEVVRRIEQAIPGARSRVLAQPDGDTDAARFPIRSYRTFGYLEVQSALALQARDLDYIQAMADILAVAWDRREAERVSLGQTSALVTTLNALAAGPDLDSFLRQALDALIEQLQAAEASLWFYDGPAGSFRLHAVRPEAAASPADPPLADARWREMLSTRRPAPLPPDVLQIPMLLGDDPIGLIRVHTREPRPFRMEEMDLAQALAQQATLAVEWARLAEWRHNAAMVEERNRMAREIHDVLAQAFTGIVIQLEAAEYAIAHQPGQVVESIRQARDLAREGLAEARRSVWALRPQALEASGLSEALAGLVRQMADGSGVRASFGLSGVPRPLPPDREHALLRIGQEAITNALRHAEAQTLRVELAYEPESVRLSVLDDGRGFDPDRPAPGDRFGLVSMRERSESIGGRLTIHSRAGQGTYLQVEAPAPSPTSGAAEP